MRAIMIQGTGSNVGKSLLVAGLCRAARRRGIDVAPFKPQNMSNNAAVTADGGEIGRAQALQARASGLDAMREMNPVLIKPESDTGAQVIVQGEPLSRVEARDYRGLRPRLAAAVSESFARLCQSHELVIVEGAGSPAEINLRPHDIANMGFARPHGVPVILAGNIDRGGVIAQIVGTRQILDPEDVALIKGFIVNKFRGDPTLFADGYAMTAQLSGWAAMGLVPWWPDAIRLPAEDAVDLRHAAGRSLRVACLALSRIANFDDLDPLAAEPEVDLRMIGPGQALPGDCDLVILPGTKSTRADLDFLRAQGWDIDLRAHLRRGGHILGLCGGYQILGTEITDPDGLDGAKGSSDGLGLLNVSTRMAGPKRRARVSGHAFGAPLSGYEIHMGISTGPDTSRPFAHLPHPDGAISADGQVMGSYLHGLFADDAFRAAFLGRFSTQSTPGFEARIDATLDGLAAHLETHLDIDAILNAARRPNLG